MGNGAADTAIRACANGGARRPGDRARYALVRAAGAWILGIAGLAAYNWWLLVPLRPGLMTSPDELFSNLEVTGQPYAALMQHADLSAGLLLLAAFALTGPASWRRGRGEWLAMLGFAAAGALGGLWPEVCADGVSAACRRLEYHFQLPAGQYIHMAAGIGEFAAITVAVLWAVARTRGTSSRFGRIYRMLARAALIAYPLLGAAYLTDRLGGIMEAVFFAGFAVMAATQLVERTRALRSPQEAPDSAAALCAS
ncbi:MAG TPA: DUF998 domain-containing protein [Streptosporangiaceae bacterium]